MTSKKESAPAPYLDLDELDYFTFGHVDWESQLKSARVSLRLPPAMLAALKQRAAECGTPYHRLIRQAIERIIEDVRNKP
jgi:predicted DNA binding CopG/RHH family protein